VKKILIADDDENILESLTDIFELNGYQVVSAKNGEEAMAKLHAETPDLLIADFNMPELDGASMAYEIKNNKKISKLPIVFISGMIQRDAPGSQGPAMENTYYVSKPFEVDKLIALVKKITGE